MKRPKIYLLLAAAFAVVVGCAAAAPTSTIALISPERAVMIETCAFYSAIDPGHGKDTFEAFLAESCGVAIAQLDTKDGRHLKMLAADYLVSLRRLKDAELALIESRTNAQYGSGEPSQTGRFLMARHLKVLDTYGLWSGAAQAHYGT